MDFTDERLEQSSLSDGEWLLLCDLVHEVAAQEAADAINAGDSIDYLLARGYTWKDLRGWLDDSDEQDSWT